MWPVRHQGVCKHQDRGGGGEVIAADHYKLNPDYHKSRLIGGWGDCLELCALEHTDVNLHIARTFPKKLQIAYAGKQTGHAHEVVAFWRTQPCSLLCGAYNMVACSNLITRRKAN